MATVFRGPLYSTPKPYVPNQWFIGSNFLQTPFILPFNQDDWVNPRITKSDQVPFTQNWNTLYGTIPVGKPFAQLDWPNPPKYTYVNNNLSIFPQAWSVFYGPASIPGKPFAQLDWPNPILAPGNRIPQYSEDAVWQNLLNTLQFTPPVITPYGNNPWIAGMGKMMGRQ